MEAGSEQKLEQLCRYLNISRDDVANEGRRDPRRMLEAMLYVECIHLIPDVASCAGMSERQLRNSFSGLTIVPTESDASVNGWVAFDSDRFHIAVNLALVDYFHQMAKIWATRFRPDSQDSDRHSSTDFSFDYTVEKTSELLEAFWTGTIHRTEPIPIEQLSNWQVSLAQTLCSDGERFILGHEFGHVMMHNSKGKFDKLFEGYRQLVDMFDTSSDLLSTLPRHHSIEDWSEEDIFNAWVKELVADTLGLKIALESKSALKERVATYWAAETYFISFQMLEQYYTGRYDYYPLNSHPPAMIRLNALRLKANLSSIPEYAVELGESLEQIADDIIDSM